MANFLRLAICVISFFLATGIHAKTLVIGTTNIATETAPEVVVLIREAYKSINQPIKIITYPSSRSLVLANNNDIDGDLMRISQVAESYPNLIKVSPPISILKVYIYSKNSTGKLNKDLTKNLRMVGVRGIQGHTIAANFLNVEPILVGDMTAALKMLMSNRVDFIVHTGQFAEVAQSMGYDIISSDKPLFEVQLHHYLHKDNKLLAERVGRAISEIQQQHK